MRSGYTGGILQKTAEETDPSEFVWNRKDRQIADELVSFYKNPKVRIAKVLPLLLLAAGGGAGAWIGHKRKDEDEESLSEDRKRTIGYGLGGAGIGLLAGSVAGDRLKWPVAKETLSRIGEIQTGGKGKSVFRTLSKILKD